MSPSHPVRLRKHGIIFRRTGHEHRRRLRGIRRIGTHDNE